MGVAGVWRGTLKLIVIMVDVKVQMLEACLKKRQTGGFSGSIGEALSQA